MSEFAQITIDAASWHAVSRHVDPALLIRVNADAPDVKAVIAWLAALDEMDRTEVVNAAGAVSRSFYE